MAMTATERSRVLRERRTTGKVVLTSAVGDDELAEIAKAGHARRFGRMLPLTSLHSNGLTTAEYALRAVLSLLPLQTFGLSGRVGDGVSLGLA
jgi:hypothetical protein